MNAEQADRMVSMPLGSILDRYVVTYFVKTFVVTLLSIVVI